MGVNIIYDNASHVSRWLHEPGSESFILWLEEYKKRVIKSLKTATEPAELYRSQGRLDVIDEITGLEVSLREYLRRAVPK